MTKQDRSEFNASAVPRQSYLDGLLAEARHYQAAGITEQVLLSFTSDPYHPGDISLTREVLEILRTRGLGFFTLTKGGTRALRDIDLFRPTRDAFADRLAALQRFHDAGIFTWISLEPTLDIESSLAIPAATHGFVDLLKIGRANYLKEIIKTTDWRDYTLRMMDLLQHIGAADYFKKDLQPYLPAGYHNPLRVPQHH
jgi:hypothetical protein